jgi:hypothetical protein
MSGSNVQRTWGRTFDEFGNSTWVGVSTDANGLNDQLNLTWLCQVLKLNLGESPFYANWGIPAQQTVVTQVFPDYYVMQIQRQFATAFASLAIARVPGSIPPTYNVSVVTHSGAVLTQTVAT